MPYIRYSTCTKLNPKPKNNTRLAVAANKSTLERRINFFRNIDNRIWIIIEAAATFPVVLVEAVHLIF
ncbi:hypothetical protein [Candidatus Endomicrobiellum agilis]|uniref:hypothetical protein n=1 Tax=Candidatus Endomicrobiellum agilis TaxID=3238957 RepID=UPI003574D145|nr:hypothetical protein [Endomicrobium sp.]